MSNEALLMSNDVMEFFFVSSTEAPPTTTEASTTTTTTTTSTTEPTTTAAPPLLAAEIVMEFDATTMAPPTTEAVVSTEDTTTTTPTTEVVVSTEETTTVPPLVTAEVVLNTEETIDWSTFADELEEKLRKGAGSDEQAAEDGDKAVAPQKEISVESKSYFSCSSPTVADDGSISFPGTEILLEYDYDLTTVADLDESTLSGLDDAITENLAEIFGLTACMRRHLRGLKPGIAILALDSKPADVSVASISECATQVVDETISCTPISGFMTAFVEPNTDAEGAKVKLLSLIEDGMASGKYNDDNIIETSYIGSRPVKGADEVVDDINFPLMSEIKVVPLEKKGPPTVAIAISVFLLGFAALVLLYEFVAHKPKKGNEEQSDKSTKQPVKHDVEKVESDESTVDDLTEKESLTLHGDMMYGNIESTTLSSSGEDDELPYTMTEDYSDLSHHLSNGPDTTYHPESCLAVIASDSSLETRSYGTRSFETETPVSTPITSPVSSPKMNNGPDMTQEHPEACLAVMGEARFFETGTPITTPISSPISSPPKLLPCAMSSDSVEEDLLADVDYGTTLDSILL